MRNRCFSPFTPPIPTQFSDALSYEQQIEVLYKKVFEALEWMKNHKAEVMSAVMTEMIKRLKKELADFDKKYEDKFSRIDYQLLKLAESIGQLTEEVESNYNILDDKIDAAINLIQNESETLYNRIKLEELARKKADTAITNELHNTVDILNERITDIANRLTALQQSYSLLEIQFIQFKEYVELRFGQLKNELTAYIDEHISIVNGNSILVTNPSTGNKDVLRDVLADIWNYRFPYSITCKEFNDLHLTCQQFDALKLTCYDFNNKAALIFNHWNQDEEYLKLAKELQDQIQELKNQKWWSQLYAGLVSPYDAYAELASFVKQLHGIGFTCAKFNAENYTCLAFDSLQMTCHDFNSHI